MALKDLAIWNRKSDISEPAETRHPMDLFRSNFNSMLDDFFSDDLWSFPSIGLKGDRFSRFSPTVNVSEDDAFVRVEAELPGMAEKDIDVSLKDHVLTIKVEKKLEKEDNDKEFHRIERSYGSFQRSIELPCDVKADDVKATFKNGVLNIQLPKAEEAKQKARRIEVKSA